MVQKKPYAESKEGTRDMKLPILELSNSIIPTRDSITQFGGYNRNDTCGESEAYNEYNMISDRSLLLTPRQPRVTLKSNVKACKGMHVNNGLLEIKKDSNNLNNVLFFNDTRIAQLPGTGERQMCSMGAYVIIWPDKMRFNTLTSELESLECEYKTTGSVSFTPCTLEGTTINPTVSSTMPSNPSNVDYWLDTSVTPNTLKVWAQSEGMWNAVATSYVKITASNIGKDFKKLDVVKISGVTGTYADTFNVDMCIWDRTNDSIIVTALINSTFTNSGITINKEVPDMDYICEHGNRLWGCSSSKHEIYASKLGDPTNFKSYIGTAADAYAVTVGTDGDFTGCVEHGGTVVFFKEKYIHKIYGVTPANFQVDTKPERGVQAGSYKSLKIISGVLYYKAVDGVVRYEGSYPVLISQNFGNVMYKNASAGAYKDKYYIRLSNINDSLNDHKLFVFDTTSGIWNVEDFLGDATDLDYFTTYKNRLIMWDNREEKIMVEGSDRNFDGQTLAESTEEVEWMWCSGLIGAGMPLSKYISQILIRLEMELGAEISVMLEYDKSLSDFFNGEEATHIKNEYAQSRRDTPGYTDLRTIELPIVPKRCDHMRIALKGKGMVKVYSISKQIEGGGV